MSMDVFIKTVTKEAGAIALSHFKNGVTRETKSTVGDLLTPADVAVSEFLVAKIKETYPDHGILSEELSDIHNPDAEYRWVIDPIDGTRNFAMGIPFWCVLVALVHNGETILGAMYSPLSDEMFFAEKGKGAYRNDEQIHVNNTSEIAHAFGVFARAYHGGIYGDRVERYRAAMTKLNLETDSWIHNYGTILIAGYIANGGVDFLAGNAGMEWDFRAPFLICEEAGAVVTDSDGNPWQAGRQDYVIANPEIYPKVMALFQP